MTEERYLPRLSEEQKKRAINNGAFERRYSEMSIQVVSQEPIKKIDPVLVEGFKALLLDIQRKTNDTLITSGQTDLARKIMEEYTSPFLPLEHPTSKADQDEAKEPPQAYVAVIQNAKTSSPQQATMKDVPPHLFMVTTRTSEGINVECAWTSISRNKTEMINRLYEFKVGEDQSQDLEELLAYMEDKDHIVVHKADIFEHLKEVYDHHRHDGLFHQHFRPIEIRMILEHLDMGEFKDLESKAEEFNIDPSLVSMIYPKTPQAALLHRIYAKCKNKMIEI